MFSTRIFHKSPRLMTLEGIDPLSSGSFPVQEPFGVGCHPFADGDVCLLAAATWWFTVGWE